MFANNLKDGETVLGSPALDVTKQIKAMIVYKSLPEMSKKIAELEKELKELHGKVCTGLVFVTYDHDDTLPQYLSLKIT